MAHRAVDRQCGRCSRSSAGRPGRSRSPGRAMLAGPVVEEVDLGPVLDHRQHGDDRREPQDQRVKLRTSSGRTIDVDDTKASTKESSRTSFFTRQLQLVEVRQHAALSATLATRSRRRSRPPRGRGRSACRGRRGLAAPPRSDSEPQPATPRSARAGRAWRPSAARSAARSRRTGRIHSIVDERRDRPTGAAGRCAARCPRPPRPSAARAAGATPGGRERRDRRCSLVRRRPGRARGAADRPTRAHRRGSRSRSSRVRRLGVGVLQLVVGLEHGALEASAGGSP